MKKILIPIVLLFIHHIEAQQSGSIASLPNIIPPSPTAYALGNYGNVPVGLFTGAPNISVPLFNYKTNNISLPFNLFYGSNGIKVDEVATNVGLGWNLNFGGVITRMVRDRADETSTHIAIPEVIDGAYTNPVTNNFLYTLGNGTDALDTEADMYSFNFNGYSGKFFYDQNNQPHIIDQQAVKIERTGNTNGDGQDFLLTVPTGEKYYFTEKERSTYRTRGIGHGGQNLLSSAITSWYLSKIVHPNKDEIYFKYENGSLEYTSSEVQALKMSVGYPGIQPSCQNNPQGFRQEPAADVIVENSLAIQGKKIVSISSNNPTNGTISFIYESDNDSQDIEYNKKITNIYQKDINGDIIESVTFNYLNTTNKRNFLSSLMFKNPKKTYNFEYETPDQFPERLSKKQDHWGYFNGALLNNNLIPKGIFDYGLYKFNYGGADKEPYSNFSKLGMLRKIIYPTKGYTELEYEGNTYWGEKTIYPELYTKKLEVKTDNQTNDNQVEYTFISPTNQKVTINASLLGNGVTGCSSFISSGHIAGTLEVRGVPYDLTRDNSSHIISIDVLAGETITVKVRSDFYCSKVKADISYYPTAPQTFNTNLDTGGVRVKSTKDINDAVGQPIYKRYYYAHKDDITHSSGHKGKDPYYTNIQTQQIKCPPLDPNHDPQAPTVECTFVENKLIVLSSSSLIPLYDTGTMSCLYPFVTISEGGDQFENGGEMKEFKVQRDTPGSNIYGPGGFINSPWTNRGWNNGVELKSSILAKKPNSSALEIIQERENVYEKNDSATFENKNFIGKQLFNVVCNSINAVHPYTCTAADVIKPNNLCSGQPVNKVVNLYDLENLNITEYRNISYWHYLKSQKTTDYLNGTPVKTETAYFYNNPSHYQLTRQKNTLPDGTVNETNFSYAHEKSNQYLIGKNMVGIPLETEITKNGKVISKTENLYPSNPSDADTKTSGLPLPYAALSQDLLNGSMTGEIRYDKYDDKGNLLQYTTKEGTPVSIIWGYNQTKPIAKIEGLAYSWLLQNYPDTATIMNASDTDANAGVANDETVFLSVLQTFRAKLSIDRFRPLVSTYTYDPLVGVRSITSPSGIRENYTYDSSGRLEKVTDMNGKVLKEMKYNYKN